MTSPGMPSPPLPPAFELRADAAWRHIDFISDLHLSGDTPATFEAWAHYLRSTPADAVFILGDLFEVWVGDDARHEGFEARCAEVLKQASARVKVGFMAGNRDFLVGAEMLDACGVQRLPDPTLLAAFGQRVLLTHGDALCLADTDYLKFRDMVRSDAWQHQFLSQPLEARQHYARDVRQQSEARKRANPSPADWADVDAPAAVECLRAAESHEMVHGHTHRPGSEALAAGFRRHVLSDWELDHPPHRAEVLRLGAGGFERLALPQALATSSC
jgi:UDP-2,3-diacylglucosamine hydrolase